MRIRCPHCHEAFDTPDDSSLESLACPACAGSFHVHLDETVAGIEEEQHSGNRESIAHFELLERLGAGGYGAVWKAHDTRLDRVVALKLSKKESLSTHEADFFLREARSAAQLKHPNIASIHEVGRQGGTLYIVSDYIAGETLADRMRSQRFSQREAVSLGLKIASALDHAHQAGVIHRDLKPGNIMIGPGDEPSIVDFGLARRESGEVTVTMTGQILGTVAYMSPEQASGEGHSADCRSDIYSLGVILFELLTGERPFRGNTQAVIYQTLNHDAPPPRTLNHRIPRDLDAICQKALAREPQRRYQTARELAADLESFLARLPVKARPVNPLKRAWQWCQRTERIRDAGRFTVFTGILLLVWAMSGIAIVLSGVLPHTIRRGEAIAGTLGFSCVWALMIVIGRSILRNRLVMIWIGWFLALGFSINTLLTLVGVVRLELGGVYSSEPAFSPLFTLFALLALTMLVVLSVALLAWHSNPHVVRWTRYAQTPAGSTRRTAVE